MNASLWEELSMTSLQRGFVLVLLDFSRAGHASGPRQVSTKGRALWKRTLLTMYLEPQPKAKSEELHGSDKWVFNRLSRFSLISPAWSSALQKKLCNLATKRAPQRDDGRSLAGEGQQPSSEIAATPTRRSNCRGIDHPHKGSQLKISQEGLALRASWLLCLFCLLVHYSGVA